MSSLPDYNTLKSAITTCWDRSKINNNWITFLDSIPKADNTPGAKGDGDSEGTQDNNQDLLTFIANTGLVEILSEADIHASDLLSKTADRLGVKSWQLSEYVEQLKEELGLTSDQYIRYEKAESPEVSQTPEQAASGLSSTSALDAPAESLAPTTIDPAKLPQNHAQPKTQSLVPLLLSGIGILLLILIAVSLKEKTTNDATQEISSINKNSSSNEIAQNTLTSPNKREPNSTSTSTSATLNQTEKRFNCRFPTDESNYEYGICKVIKRTNANNHVVYDVYPDFVNLNKFAVVLWDNNTAEFFYEGERYEANTSNLNNQFISITGINTDYSFSFIPKPHN